MNLPFNIGVLFDFFNSPRPTNRVPGRGHIVHILSSFDMGGQERVAFELAVGQLREGYRVTALSLAPPPDGPLAGEFSATGAAVARVVRPKPGVDLRLILRLSRWLRDHGADLVHTHNRMALIYGAPAARLAGAAVVHTKHGINPRGGTRLLAGKLAARCLDAFVAVSEETAAFARRRNEIDERRLTVIPNGIDLDRFHLVPIPVIASARSWGSDRTVGPWAPSGGSRWRRNSNCFSVRRLPSSGRRTA